MSSFKVIVVGSGLAGSLLANGLLRNNIDVSIYERLPKETKREGYQIRLGAPALEGFRACLTPEQIEGVVKKFGRANGAKTGAPVVYDQNFNEILDLGKFPSYEKSAPINRLVLREALAEPLEKKGVLQYSKSFQRYEILDPSTDKERVRVWFDDGETAECDILIGADGTHSRINQQVGLNNISQLKSHLVAVAKSELPTAKYVQMTPTLSRSPVITFSDNKSLYFCAYLPDKYDDAGSRQTEQFDDELSSSMFGVFIPLDICPPDLLERPNAEKWKFISHAFKGWAPEYHETIDLVNKTELYMYKPRVGTKPSKSWRRDIKNSEKVEQGHPRVWLLGDAVHPMLPSRGMGGNQAMCDTASMLPLLVKLAQQAKLGPSQMNSDIAKACQTYEDEMIPRAFNWVMKSGGHSPVAVDSNTWLGRSLFFMAAQLSQVAYLVTLVLGPIWTSTIDDAPELKA